MDQASACTSCLASSTRATKALGKCGFYLLRLPIAWLVSLAVVVGMSSGCSEGVERVKVSGRVLIDGNPVPAGFIRVFPEGARDSSSNLDSEGRFELRSYNPGDGVPLGTHKVVVNGSQMLSPYQKQWHAPPEYSRISSSGLTLEVTGSTEDAVINLTWEGGKPFVQKVNKTGE